MLDALLLDPLLDSLRIFLIAFVFHVVFSFIEEKVSSLLIKNKAISPLIGSFLGIIPQCGVSILASDLYKKRHITIGTLCAIFICCSDESLPLLFTSQKGLLTLLPLLLIKIVLGFIFGYLLDCFYKKQEIKELNEEEQNETHVGCCHHHIEGEESKIKEHLVHPLIHSLKIFIYVFIINVIFASIIYYIGEDNIVSFLSSSIYLQPLLSCLIGLIPNCASSVIITNLYLINGLSLGGLLSGLIVNTGLGMFYLLKEKECRKDGFIILIILLVLGLAIGYIITGLNISVPLN